MRNCSLRYDTRSARPPERLVLCRVGSASLRGVEPNERGQRIFAGRFAEAASALEGLERRRQDRFGFGLPPEATKSVAE